MAATSSGWMGGRAVTARAPYAVGDRLRVLCMDCQGATTSAVVVAERVVALNSGSEWRVETTRPGHSADCRDCFPRLHVVVGHDGTDRHGYVERVTR